MILLKENDQYIAVTIQIVINIQCIQLNLILCYSQKGEKTY